MTYAKVNKKINLTIEPNDYNKFVILIEDALAHLNDIKIKCEEDKSIADIWKDVLPLRAKYAKDLLQQITN